MQAAQSEWEALLTRMGVLDDFQAREYRKLTVAQLERSGQSLQSMNLMVRWQADCMLAYADGRPPPFPPADVDLQKMAEQAQRGSSPMGALGSATAITAQPFTGEESAFQSPIVREEWEALCRDHEALVTMGERYGGFDPLGKLAYLDALEAVEGRWDVLFSRFQLMGAVNPEFREQTEAFLQGMGLSPAGLRDLLSEAHTLMREDAERERTQ